MTEREKNITKTMHSCIYYMYSATVVYVILMLDMFLAMAIARSQNYKSFDIPKICQIWKNFGRGKPWQMPPLTEE